MESDMVFVTVLSVTDMASMTTVRVVVIDGAA